GCAARVDMAARRRPPGRGWTLADVPLSAHALSRARVFARAGVLLSVRAASVPFRLARRPVGSRRQPECRLACGLRGGLGFLDRAERLRARAETAAESALRRDRRTAVAQRGSRPPRAAVPRVARASRPRLAAAAGLLGPANPARHHPRRPRDEVRRGSRRTRRAAGTGRDARVAPNCHAARPHGLAVRARSGARPHAALVLAAWLA